MNRSSISIVGSVLTCAIALLSGCASTTPSADFSRGMPLAARVKAADEVKARVEGDKDVRILDLEKTRLAQKIEQRVGEKKIQTGTAGDKKNYEVEVTLTEYEKGSAFARAMLAGLGQIRIAGIVRMYGLPDRQKIGEFTLSKTFAWGGAYGASTSIEDIENTFADGIAVALTEQDKGAQSGSNASR